MNTMRLIAIALPVMLLLACGGGGGGTVATPTTGGGGSNPLAGLSDFMPTADSSTIQTVEVINKADGTHLLLSDVYEAENLNAGGNKLCGNRECVYRDLHGVDDDPEFDMTTPNPIPNILALHYGTDDLVGHASRITGEEEFNGTTLAIENLTGTISRGDTPIEFKVFAGWLDGSIFSTTQISIGASGSQEYRFIAQSVGVPTGSNPSSTGSATWEGATVATMKADRTFILGDAEITVNFTDTNVDLMFDNWRGLDNQAVSGMSAITYNDLALSSGSFTGSGNEQVQGRFYGTAHTEVGGFFNTETVTGAFGGTRQ